MYYKTDVLAIIVEYLINMECWERQANRTDTLEEMNILEKKILPKTKLIDHYLLTKGFYFISKF